MKLQTLQKILSNVLSGIVHDDHVYFVGGCVRDHLLDRGIHDFDLFACSKLGALPCAEFLFYKGITTEPVVYNNSGTVSSHYKKVKIEISQPVVSSSGSIRHSNNDCYTELCKDALRRDFTINALYMRIIDKSVVDASGMGLQDIKDKIIRCTSDPKSIFETDPSRLLRAIRLACELGFDIESKTWSALCDCSSKIQEVAIEKVSDEIDKILISQSPSRGIELLDQSGILIHIIPELTNTKFFEQNKYHSLDVFHHSLTVIESCSNNLILRWAALLHDIGKPETLTIDQQGNRHFYKHELESSIVTNRILLRLKQPKVRIQRIKVLVKHHMVLKNTGPNGEKASDRQLRRLIVNIGRDLDLLLNLIHADNISHKDEHQLANQVPMLRLRLKKIDAELRDINFPVTGKDIICTYRIPSSPLIGRLLKIAREKWYADLSISKADLLIYLGKYIEH